MNYTKGDVILLKYPFTSFEVKKIRPAIVISTHNDKYDNIFEVPVTSRIYNLAHGEFVLDSWQKAGLNVPSAVKRRIYLIDRELILKKLNKISNTDLEKLYTSIKFWLGI